MGFWGTRHEKLVDIEVLKNSSLLVAGVGGLGCTVCQLLLRLGVGELYLVDSGIVDEPDLNRQILYDFEDIGSKKAEVAVRKLSSVFPKTRVRALCVDILGDDFRLPNGIMGVVDCLDNWCSRFRLESLAREKGVFLVHAGVKEMYGQITTVFHPDTPSLEEIFGNPPEEDSPQVYPPLVVAVASFQVWETVNALLGAPRLLGKLLVLDLWGPSLEVISLAGGSMV